MSDHVLGTSRASQPSRRMSSSPASSLGPSVLGLYNCWSLEQGSSSISDCANVHQYTLDDLCKHFCPIEQNREELQTEEEGPEDLCTRLVQKLFDVHVKVRKLVVLLKDKIPPMLCTSDQRPDVHVYGFNSRADVPEAEIPATIIEVHSSPYENTIIKAILVGTDLCRHYAEDSSQYTAFAFPKNCTKQCVVKVIIRWQGLSFKIFLELIELDNVRDALAAVLRAWNPIPLTSAEEQPKSPFVVKLSSDDLCNFGENAFQIPTMQSIMVKSEGFYYKRPLKLLEAFNLKVIGAEVSSLLANNIDVHVIHLVATRIMTGTDFKEFHKYKVIKHDHLSHSEAYECLKDLIKKVHTTLIELHQYLHRAHLDVRLENICFND